MKLATNPQKSAHKQIIRQCTLDLTRANQQETQALKIIRLTLFQLHSTSAHLPPNMVQQMHSLPANTRQIQHLTEIAVKPINAELAF
jgi:hypothetical protein